MDRKDQVARQGFAMLGHMPIGILFVNVDKGGLRRRWRVSVRVCSVNLDAGVAFMGT